MPPPKKYTAAQLRERKNEAERRRRDRIRNDPVLREEEKLKKKNRYEEGKLSGKIKLISQLTRREIKAKRQQWRESSKKSYDRKLSLKRVLNLTPPSSPAIPLEYVEMNNNVNGRSRAIIGRKRIARNRSAANRALKKQKKENENLKKCMVRYKQRYYRLLNKYHKNMQSCSPNTKVDSLLHNQTPEGRESIKKNLVFGEVLRRQLASSYKTMTAAQRKSFVVAVKGETFRRYKHLTKAGEFFSYKIYRSATHRNIRNVFDVRYLQRKSRIMSLEVEKFLKNDENSRCCPGKKDFISYKRNKFQKRYLNDTLLNLWKKFLRNSPTKISYTTFCRFKPTYIVHASHTGRDTCLCSKHENFKFLMQSLKIQNVFNYTTVTSLIESICCDDVKEECLTRNCVDCRTNAIQLSQFDGAVNVSYWQWRIINEQRTIKGSLKTIKRTIKEKCTSTLKDVVLKLLDQIPLMMEHIYRIRHQYQALAALKNRRNEMSIHMDFSENYVCKYATEPQAVHFGASRQQISLHTVVVHCNGEKICFATISENLRHDAQAVAAHLKPVLEFLFEKFNVNTVHFQSDGPTTQYRNKTMFTILGKVLPKMFPTITKLSWNFTESGHGKGSVDGVGGTLKRTADRLVAENKDVSSLSSFYELLTSSINKINIFIVNDNDFIEMDEVISRETIIPTIKKTMRTHQVTWNSSLNCLQFNEVSCFACELGRSCSHFQIAPPFCLGSPAFPIPEIHEGNWIAVVYEDEWYPGIIEKIMPQNKEVLANFMAPAGKNKLFHWPSPPDRQRLKIEGILYVLKKAPIPVTTRLNKIEEYNYIDFLKNDLGF